MVAVRLATIDGANAIAHLTADVQQLHNKALPNVFKPPSEKLFPREKLAALLQDPKSTVAVAEIKGEVVGYVYGATMHRAESDFKKPETYMYVQQIGVRKDARRQGIGAALITFVESRAVASSLTGLQLDYWAFNACAQRFFESCGFSPSQVMMRRAVKALPPQ
jgi:diamine N-acetyltransferase